MYSCQRCGKGTIVGSNSAHKHGGAWAMRAPKSSKVWRPNLHRTLAVLDGKTGRYWLCTKCQRIAKKLPNPKAEQMAKANKETQSQTATAKL